MGWAYFRLEQRSRAIRAFQDSLGLAQVSADLPAQGWALSNLGSVYFSMGSWERAIAYYQKALKVRRQIEPSGIFVGRSLQNLANVHLKIEDWESSFFYAKKALLIQQRNDDQFGLSFTLEILALFLANYYILAEDKDSTVFL